MTGKTIYLVKVWYYDTVVKKETDFIAYAFFDYKRAVSAANGYNKAEIVATTLLCEK